MTIGSLTRFGVGAALLGVAGCAPIVWDRPGTTPTQLSMDEARCKLVAEGANPAPDTGTISTGHFGRDLAANAAAGLAEGLVQGLSLRHTYALCMHANGYVEHTPGTAPAPQAVAASPVPVQLAPLPSPVPIAAIPARPDPEPVRTRYYPPPILVKVF